MCEGPFRVGKQSVLTGDIPRRAGEEAAVSVIMDLFDVTRGTAEHVVTRVEECLRQGSARTNRELAAKDYPAIL